MNLAGLDGSGAFRVARRQIAELRLRVNAESLQSLNDEVPFWNDDTSELPEYWLPSREVIGWLERWEASFVAASRSGGLANGDE